MTIYRAVPFTNIHSYIQPKSMRSSNKLRDRERDIGRETVRDRERYKERDTERYLGRERYIYRKRDR